MTKVNIVKNWVYPDLMRQTSAHRGIWDDITFTLGPEGECDYLVILNRPPDDITVRVPPDHVWAVIQEPPNESKSLNRLHRGDTSYSRVYTSNKDLKGKRYFYSQPALPWHVNKDYDFLVGCDVPKKEKDISWITTDKAIFEGHRKRIAFLEEIQGKVEFDLYGRGFSYLEDKWDGLFPYRYSIAVENFRNEYYWTEKIADCFLAWSMPIYYGSTRISEYFPPEAMIEIDIDDPDVVDKIREAVSSERWRKNIDAIDHARKLVLEKYQLFPFIAKEIKDHEREHDSVKHPPKTFVIPHDPRPPMGIGERVARMLNNSIGSVRTKIKSRLKKYLRR